MKGTKKTRWVEQVEGTGRVPWVVRLYGPAHTFSGERMASILGGDWALL